MSLTDSHHNHHGQKPTMVGICHGGNVLGNHHDGHDDDLKITTMLTLMRSVLNAVRNWVEMRHPSTSLSISKAARVGMVYPANN